MGRDVDARNFQRGIVGGTRLVRSLQLSGQCETSHRRVRKGPGRRQEGEAELTDLVSEYTKELLQRKDK